MVTDHAGHQGRRIPFLARAINYTDYT